MTPTLIADILGAEPDGAVVVTDGSYYTLSDSDCMQKYRKTCLTFL